MTNEKPCSTNTTRPAITTIQDLNQTQPQLLLFKYQLQLYQHQLQLQHQHQHCLLDQNPRPKT